MNASQFPVIHQDKKGSFKHSCIMLFLEASNFQHLFLNAISNISGTGVGDDEEEQEGPEGVLPEAGEGRIRREQRQAQGAQAARQEDQRPGTLDSAAMRLTSMM